MTTTAAAPQLATRAPLRLHPLDLLGLPLVAGCAWLLLAAGADAVAIGSLGAVAAVSPLLARIDIVERRLPNAVTLPLLVVAVVAGLLRVGAGDLAPVAALGCGGLLFAMAAFGGMGMGDVKLGTALALAASTVAWAAPPAGLAASVMVGGIAGGVALATGRRTVAFGPWLLVGHAVAVLLVVRGAL